MAAFDVGDDDGWADITVAGVTLRVDLYRADSRRAQIAAGCDGKPDHEFYDAVIAWMVELGYPTVSQATASRFAKAIIESSKALEKKGEAGSGLPVSTV